MVHPPGPSTRTAWTCSTDHCSALIPVGRFCRKYAFTSSRSRGCIGRSFVVQASAKTWDVGCRLAGVGSSVPPGVLSNTDLEKLVETNDEWIRTRTGISRRHVLGENESLSQHAAQASRKAMEMAGVSPEDIDMIILATSSPDDVFGSGCTVQSLIGAKNAVALDLTAACSGFVVGLVLAAQNIRTGLCRNVLVIGADALSRYVDWRDRGTCILFGDGCGAVVLTQQQGACSLISSQMHSDGEGNKHLNALFMGEGNKALSNGHASSVGSFANIKMNGPEVYRFAVSAVPSVVKEALDKAGLEKEHIDWLVLHQANQRILDSAATKLGIPHEKVVSNLAEYGNTSAASIPLALDEAVRSGQIKPGDTIVFAGFGAGLTWASAIAKWG